MQIENVIYETKRVGIALQFNPLFKQIILTFKLNLFAIDDHYI